MRATVSGVYADSPEFGLVCSPVLVSPDGSGDFFRLSDAIAVSGNGFVIETADGTHAGLAAAISPSTARISRFAPGRAIPSVASSIAPEPTAS